MGPSPPSAKPTIEGGLGAVKNGGGAEYDFSIAVTERPIHLS